VTRGRVVIATRKSALALAQSRAFIARLAALHPDVAFEELLVTTTGDVVQDRPLAAIGGKGLFVKEIEEALLDGRADIAIHSLKDVPPQLLPSLSIECIPEREDPRDVLVTRSGATLAELASGSRVGTGSLRRRVQLLAYRSDLGVARSAATSTRDCASASRARSTRWCWREPVSTAYRSRREPR